MKHKLLFTSAFAALLTIPQLVLAQAPVLGSTTDYVLFSSAGAVGNTAISHVTGNIGTNAGAISSFGNVDGVLNAANGSTAMALTDLSSLYTQLNGTTTTATHAAVLGGGEILTTGVYAIASAGTVAGKLILNAAGDQNAQFIFKIGGAFATAALTEIELMNGTQACNVFWIAEGAITMGAGTKMKGTLIANNADIALAAGGQLEGRMFSTSGAVAIDGATVTLPLGCGKAILTGPVAPTLGKTECYAIFSSSGAVTNTTLSNVTGDIGTNVGATTGYTAINVTGTIHASPDASTATCATDLISVYNHLKTLPADIELLYPAQMGNKLVLTPHTYILNAATAITDTLYLNAQNNPNGVFVFLMTGALTTGVNAKVILMNGAQAKNVYWLVKGSVSLNSDVHFKGTVVCDSGAVDMAVGVLLNGRALTTLGDFTTSGITAIVPTTCVLTDTKSLNKSDNAQVSVYPNPFTQSVTFDLSNVTTTDTQISIYDVVGTLVLKTSLTKQANTVDASQLPAGVYVYTIYSANNTIQSGRLIAQ